MRFWTMVCALFLCSACGTQGSESSVATTKDNSYERFPLAPMVQLTPGKVCENPDRRRYPEGIGYCERDVSSSTKRAIIEEYDDEFGFAIGRLPRSDFKIDHYISLCMGGSNSTANLWPQHKSVYEHTDPLEGKLCQLMAQGKMLQQDAIDTLKYAKNNIAEARDIERDLDEMLAN